MIEINTGVEGLLSSQSVDKYLEQMNVEDFIKPNLHDVNEIMIVLNKCNPDFIRINDVKLNLLGGKNAKPLVNFDHNRNRTVATFTYQSEKQFGKEYPVLDINIAVWKTPKGKLKMEFVKHSDVKYSLHSRSKFWGY